MIRKYILEIVFLLAGVVFFMKSLPSEVNFYPFNSNYFLSNSSNVIASKRDFSFGKSESFSKVDLTKIQIPIVNLSVDEKDLFDFEEGVYSLGVDWHNSQTMSSVPWWKQQANYRQKGYLSERNVEATFYDNDGVRKRIQSKIKINGNNTRSYPQKSIRIKDKGQFQSLVFNESSSNWIILRNSGNDWDRTMFSDAFCSDVISELNVISAQSSPVNVYLNNKYWGLYNARQRIDENFIASKHKTEKSKVLLFEFNGRIKAGGGKAKKELDKLIEDINGNNLDKLLNSIDVDNFIDYFIVETYFNNSDWPSNNVLFYKIDSKDEKWQFIPKDLDYAMAYTSDEAYKKNTLKHALKKKDVLVSELFVKLLENKSFKNRFKERVETVLEIALSEELLLKKYDLYEATYRMLMPKQIDRWRYPKSMNSWENYVEKNRLFIQNRNIYYLKQLNSK